MSIQDHSGPTRPEVAHTPVRPNVPSGKINGLPTGAVPPSKQVGPKPGSPPSRRAATGKKSSLETVKAESKGLRANLAEELQKETDHFEEVEKQILKFHGIYQQDDRDDRQGGKSYSFLIRSKIPGGRLTAEQYLAHEDLADRFGNGTLRITTRQDFQLHGVIKMDLQEAVRTLNEHLVTTLGACGDVVRNVMYRPVPASKPYEHEIERIAHEISDHLLPATRAYHEIWIDGEQVYDGKETVETLDPIYRDTYLPRKFKIGVAFPGDNSIDVYTQDVGLIAVVDEDQLKGFNVVVGGGLGMTHKKPDTFPRLADPLAFVTPEETVNVVKEIVLIQRDHGDRENRKAARLKYLIHNWGIDRFRSELESRLGYTLQDWVPVPALEMELYLGWHRQDEEYWYLGVSVENGRIKDEGDLLLKRGLHEVITRFRPGVSLTPSQDIILTNIRERDRLEITSLLRTHGIRMEEELSQTRKYSMACPALPTCPLAITESERVLPSLIDELETEIIRLGLADEKLSVRMTGCPNGCARPYVADIGLVGRSLDQYTIFLGGRLDGTRLNQVFLDLVSFREIVPTLRPVLTLFKAERKAGEGFGDFCHRLGIETLKTLTEDEDEYAKAS